MFTENDYRRRKRLGIDHPAYQGNRELMKEHNVLERDERQHGIDVLGASIQDLRQSTEELLEQYDKKDAKGKAAIDALIARIDASVVSEIDHVADMARNATEFQHRSLVFNFFLSVLRHQKLQKYPVVQGWQQDPHASIQSIARIMQNSFAGLPRDFQELILTTHAEQVAVERARFQERVARYKTEFHARSVEYVHEHNLDIDEQLIADRLAALVVDSGDMMRAELSDSLHFGKYEAGNNRIIVFLHPMLLGLEDDSAASRAAMLAEEKLTIMHELVHAILEGEQPAVQISGSGEKSAAIDRIIDQDITSDNPEMFGPDGLIYDPLFEADARMDYFFMKHGLSFQGTDGRDLDWLNEAVTSSIQHAMFPDESARDRFYQDETALYTELKKVIPEELFLRAYTENAQQESTTKVSSPVHTKALLRAINDAFAPGFYVRLQKYIHNHSVRGAIEMMQVGRWREELFPPKNI